VSEPLIDTFGRIHRNVRISVTDRCNIRCFYCMPESNIRFKPRSALLTFEEIARVVGVLAGIGIHRVRLTGGEPLVRAELPRLIAMLKVIDAIDDLALTTNGILLADQAQALRQAGLQRINISLDGLREETFRTITRREGLDRVLDGICAAQDAGFDKIRLNAVAIRGVTEAEIVPLGRFARRHELELRFIEFMPLDADGNWDSQRVLAGAEIRAQLEAAFGPLEPIGRVDPSQPSVDYRFADGRGRIGFINAVTEPFCADCNRLRINAEGQVHNCLFSDATWDLRTMLRNGGSDLDLVRQIRRCVAAKKPGHGIDQPDFIRPERAMYQIGG
jgi:GTP 3',8-cyclase